MTTTVFGIHTEQIPDIVVDVEDVVDTPIVVMSVSATINV